MKQKEYFVKYLPIKGIIKPNDLFFNKDNGRIQIADEETQEASDYWGEDLYQKVELFLCSRNINIGDKVLHLNTNKKYEIKDIHLCSNPGNYYTFTDESVAFGKDIVNVIGVIDQNADWITEGMEFDEEDIEGYCGRGEGKEVYVLLKQK